MGKTLSVLFEEGEGGLSRGHAPNYVEVVIPSEKPLHNVLLPVRITAAQEGRLLGEAAAD